MEHQAYVRIRPDATTAIMFIHGIVGTPNHFNDFIPLIPESFSVYNLLLDGHGRGVKDFAKTSMKKWEAQVSSVVEELSLTHERIYIVAHSMGTLLAIDQAIAHNRICRLFLLAVPFKLSVTFKMIANSLKVYSGKIKSDDYEALAAQKCYGIGKDKNPFHYVGWIPRFMELFAKMRRTRKSIGLLHTPCTAYQSQKDEMVSKTSVRYLRQNPCVSIHILENSGHYYYGGIDGDFLMSEFRSMLDTDV